MLIEQIKKDRIQAMKDRQKAKATALATLLGEVDTEVKRGSVLDDSLVIAKIQKTIKGIDEILKINPSSVKEVVEKDILAAYLPQMLTEEEILLILAEYQLANTGAKFGDVMKYMKQSFSGKYDPKLVKDLWEKQSA